MKIAILHPSMLSKGGAERVVDWLAVALCERGHEVMLFTSEYDDAFYGDRGSKPYALTEIHVRGDVFDWRSLIDHVVAGFRLRSLLEGYELLNPHNYPSYLWVYYARRFNSVLERAKTLWYCEEPVRILYKEITDFDCLRLDAMRAQFPEELETRSDRFNRVLAEEGGSHIRTALRWIRGRVWTATYGSLLRIVEARDRKAVPALDMVLTNSEFIAENVRKIFGIEVHACPLGIPVHEVSAPATAGDFLLTVARLQREKNVFSGVKAVEMLWREGRMNFSKYVIIGTGPEGPILQRYVERHGLSEVVEVLGFVTDEEKAHAYETCGAMLSLTLDETFGLTFLEAAQRKKPVIGPARGGPTEIIQDAETGLLVDPLDVTAIAETIERMFSSRDRMVAFGEAAYARLLAHYTFDAFVDRFLGFVRQLTGERAATSVPSPAEVAQEPLE
jgi:glycosyltransferase involved in cell wall biosynthesis